jgi:M6 family metalloprotease-like protein
MKIVKLFLLFFVLSFFQTVKSQNYSDFIRGCGTLGSSNSESRTGGVYSASNGCLRCLVVFAQFLNEGNSYWPNDPVWPAGSMPVWAHSLIDSVQASNYRPWTLSDYFKKMSSGSFDFIGDVYDSLVITDYEWTYYNDFAVVNAEIITKIKNKIDWTRYDSWNYLGNYNVHNIPDNNIDLIIIVYRWRPGTIFYYDGKPFTGIAKLGFSDALSVDSIRYVFGYDMRGGITFPNALIYGHHGTVCCLAHEYGHYLFGYNHPKIWRDSTNRYNYLNGYGLMGGLFSPCMNADEKRRLGWLENIPDLPEGETNITDYMTTNSAFKIPISDDEYFLIENHQKISDYDMAGGYDKHPVPDPVGKGLYVFHMYNTNSTDQDDIFYIPLCADGRWNWDTICTPINPCGPGRVNLYDKLSPNPQYGKNKMEIYKVFRDGTSCNDDSISTNDFTDEAHGYQEAPFNIGYNQQFNPWSNPGTYDKNHNLLNFALEVVSKNGDDFVVRFYPDTNMIPAAKPGNITVTYDDTIYYNPKVSWQPVSGDNVAGYNLYRAALYGGDTTYVKLNDSILTATVYIDSIVFPANLPSYKEINYSYFVKTVNTYNYESGPSDTVSIYYGKTLGGHITADTTLANIIIINNALTVDSGSTINVLPGTLFRFYPETFIEVRGSMNAAGTATSKIIFRFPEWEKGSGGAITCQDGQSMNLSYCNIERAYYGVYGSPDTIRISNCLFKNC